MIQVIKIGGGILENEASREMFLRQFAAVEGPKVLVHGGGRLATTMAERLGVKTQMIDGRRVTDRETLDIVTMVYGGLVNKQVVALLHTMGVNAIGLTGADGGWMRSVKRPIKNGIDYGTCGIDIPLHFIDTGEFDYLAAALTKKLKKVFPLFALLSR